MFPVRSGPHTCDGVVATAVSATMLGQAALAFAAPTPSGNAENGSSDYSVPSPPAPSTSTRA